MKKKTLISTAVSTAITLATVAGVAFASDTQLPLGNTVEPYPGQGTVKFDSLRVGDVTKGGVLFGNGTWVNEGGPLTIGDHLRVDGNIHRGAEFGINKGDNMPVKINDELRVLGKTTFEQGFDFAGGDADFNNATVKNFPGYDHNHDDRYYTESEANDRYYTKSEADGKYVAQGTETKFVTVAAPAFQPQTNLYDWVLSSHGKFLSTNDGAEDLFSADIDLPHGATVTGVKLHYKENAGTAITSKLVRLAASDEAEVDMATATSPGTGAGTIGSVEDTSISSSVIDNENYIYRLTVDFNGSAAVFIAGMTVEYTMSK